MVERTNVRLLGRQVRLERIDARVFIRYKRRFGLGWGWVKTVECGYTGCDWTPANFRGFDAAREFVKNVRLHEASAVTEAECQTV